MKLKVIFLCFMLSSCAWSTTDKALMASYVGLSAVDTFQTSQHTGGELNPFMQADDGTPDMGKVVGVKIVSGVLLYLLADWCEDYRTEILGAATAVQTGVVIYNW